MTRRVRIVTIVGLLLLAFVAFYPPVKRPPHIKGVAQREAAREWPLGQRSLLLVSDYMYAYRAPGDTANQLAGEETEIDVGRLLGEAILIVALTGVGVVLLQPGPSPAGRGN